MASSGDGKFYYPRLHWIADGESCPGCLLKAEWVDITPKTFEERRNAFTSWFPALKRGNLEKEALKAWLDLGDDIPENGLILSWIMSMRESGAWDIPLEIPNALAVIQGRMWESEAKSNGKPAETPKKLAPQNAFMKKLDEWFERNEIRPPLNPKRKTNYGTMGKWMVACEGNAKHACEVLDHCLGANKIGSTSSWGYVFTLMEAHGATGMPNGNGRGMARRGINPQSSAEDNRIRDARMRGLPA